MHHEEQMEVRFTFVMTDRGSDVNMIGCCDKKQSRGIGVPK